MMSQFKNTVLKFVISAIFVTVSNAHCETGTLVSQTGLEDKDKFYKTFVGKTDTQIEGIYKSQWDFHEKQMPYVLTSYRNEHLTPGTLGGPYEGNVRKEFASQVLRMRIDSGIKALLYEIKSPALKNVVAGYQQTMDKIRNYPLRLSNKKGNKSGEFRIGYDVLSDSSKIEYVQGFVEAGVYHPYLMGMITKAKPGLEIATLNVSSNISPTAPKATVSYPLSGKTIEASLSKSLSESVSAKLVSGQPLRDQTAPHRYEAQVAYTF